MVERFIARGTIVLATSACLSFVLPIDPTALAQSPEPSFDAVSIKRNVSGDQDFAITAQKGSTFNTTNTPMAGVIMRAYRVRNIVGAPDWLETERYDIVAKATGKSTNDEVNACCGRCLESVCWRCMSRHARFLSIRWKWRVPIIQG